MHEGLPSLLGFARYALFGISPSYAGQQGTGWAAHGIPPLPASSIYLRPPILSLPWLQLQNTPSTSLLPNSTSQNRLMAKCHATQAFPILQVADADEKSNLPIRPTRDEMSNLPTRPTRGDKDAHS